MTREELEDNDDFEVSGIEDTATSIDDDAFDLDFGDEDIVDPNEDPTIDPDKPTPVSDDKDKVPGEEEEPPVEDNEEEPADEEPDPEDGVFTPFIEHLKEKGVITPDEAKEYEDSELGFEEIINDTIETRFKDKVSKLSPEAQRLLEISEKGGDMREAFDQLYQFDYKDIDMSVEENKIELVKDHLLSQGYEEADLEETIEGLKDLNKIDKHAEIAHKFFVNKQEKEREEYVANLDKQKAERLAQEEKLVSDVKHKIDTMEAFGAFTNIPKQDREAFKSYLFDKGEDGKTQAERDNSIDAILINEFNKFKKFNYEGIEKRAKTKATIDWRKKAQRVVDNNQQSSSSRQQRYTRPDEGTFALGEI